MSSLAKSFSELTAAGTALNRKFTPGGGRASGIGGPIGPSTLFEQTRRTLDKSFGIPPIEGDPGYTPPPASPVLTPVTPMPIPGQDDLANISARRRSIEEQMRRRGRVSTVLSGQQSEPLGG